MSIFIAVDFDNTLVSYGPGWGCVCISGSVDAAVATVLGKALRRWTLLSQHDGLHGRWSLVLPPAPCEKEAVKRTHKAFH